MQISDIIKKSAKPPLYEKGSAFMWTDPHISRQLLDIHLNPDLDLGSRKMTTIQKTASWILDRKKKENLNILDLGCGPGLYTEIYARVGHQVTGVDISATSIDYARKEAASKELNITYIQASYLDLQLPENSYDLVTMIFTDFGVLLPTERTDLLDLVFRILKKGGIFIFDVLNDKQIESKVIPKNWEVTKSGFWRGEPYLALSESFLYPEEKVILYQHVVVDDRDNNEVYRFWTHFFSHSDLESMTKELKFSRISFHEDVLPPGDVWSGDQVTFCMVVK